MEDAREVGGSEDDGRVGRQTDEDSGDGRAGQREPSSQQAQQTKRDSREEELHKKVSLFRRRQTLMSSRDPAKSIFSVDSSVLRRRFGSSTTSAVGGGVSSVGSDHRHQPHSVSVNQRASGKMLMQSDSLQAANLRNLRRQQSLATMIKLKRVRRPRRRSQHTSDEDMESGTDSESDFLIVSKLAYPEEKGRRELATVKYSLACLSAFFLYPGAAIIAGSGNPIIPEAQQVDRGSVAELGVILLGIGGMFFLFFLFVVTYDAVQTGGSAAERSAAAFRPSSTAGPGGGAGANNKSSSSSAAVGAAASAKQASSGTASAAGAGAANPNSNNSKSGRSGPNNSSSSGSKKGAGGAAGGQEPRRTESKYRSRLRVVESKIGNFGIKTSAHHHRQLLNRH